MVCSVVTKGSSAHYKDHLKLADSLELAAEILSKPGIGPRTVYFKYTPGNFDSQVWWGSRVTNRQLPTKTLPGTSCEFFALSLCSCVILANATTPQGLRVLSCATETVVQIWASSCGLLQHRVHNG